MLSNQPKINSLFSSVVERWSRKPEVGGSTLVKRHGHHFLYFDFRVIKIFFFGYFSSGFFVRHAQYSDRTPGDPKCELSVNSMLVEGMIGLSSYHMPEGTDRSQKLQKMKV